VPVCTFPFTSISTSRHLLIAGRSDADADERTRKLFALSLRDAHLKHHAELSRDVNMATPDDYNSMPWVPRSTSASANHACGSSVSKSNNEALIQQLAAAHAAQQNSENALETKHAEMEMLMDIEKRKHDRRVARLEEDMKLYKQLEGERLQDKKREWEIASEQEKAKSNQRIAELEKELGQCQKREEAIKAVFFREFVKEKELLVEREHLDNKAAALNKKQTDLALKVERLRKTEHDTHNIRRLLWGDQQMKKALKSDENEYDALAEPIEPHPHGETNPFHWGTLSTQLTELNPDRYHWPQPVFIKAKDKRIISLRKHDYYAGWLDAMRAADHRKAIALESQVKKMDSRANVLGATTTYLRDSKDPRNPRNAGMNVGLLFAYSALCKQHKYTHADVRLDVRQWDLRTLKPVVREDVCGDHEFWYGVEYGVDKMKRLFELKIERGIWKTGDDAAQIALMRTRDMKKGYMVVPGRTIPPRNVHKLGRRAKGDDTG
jgi:hypothetical protein